MRLHWQRLLELLEDHGVSIVGQATTESGMAFLEGFMLKVDVYVLPNERANNVLGSPCNATLSSQGDDSLSHEANKPTAIMRGLLEADDCLRGICSVKFTFREADNQTTKATEGVELTPRSCNFLTRIESLLQSKCVFGALSLEYLGHIISGQGVEMDPKKINAVRFWPVPTNQRQVRGFLGLAGYYRRFIKDYATVAAPLTSLLQKHGFQWGEMEQKVNFDLSQNLIVSYDPKATALAQPLSSQSKSSAIERANEVQAPITCYWMLLVLLAGKFFICDKLTIGCIPIMWPSEMH
ncbi:hypothetical protein Tco_0588848 [Tanacetum coccineum]